MVGTLLKIYAYTKAPKTVFVARHPVGALHLKKFKWDMRHAYAPRVAALGAAAVAVPLGMWLGGRRTSRTED